MHKVEADRMLGVVPSFALYLIIGAVLCAALMWRTRPGIAGAALMALALTSPTWLQLPSGGSGIDVRVALSLIYLIPFCFHSQGKFRFRWNAMDTCIAMLFLVAVISDSVNDGFQWYRPMVSYGELLLPFYAGRFLLMRPGVHRRAAQFFAIATMVVGVFAVIEAMSGTSVWEALLAAKDDFVVTGDGKRYGLWYRSSGPTRHPIFLGIVLMLCIPWAITLIGDSFDRTNKILGWVTLGAIVAGIASTLSRGPIVACGIVAIVAAFIRFENARKWMAGGAVIAALLGAFFWDDVVDAVIATQDTEVRSYVVNVDGKPEAYTGTNNRLFVMKIYGPKVIEAGPLGFGSQRTSSFPPDLPGLSASVKQSKLLGIVDNSYLLFGLRYGWLGIFCLAALLVVTLFSAMHLKATSSIALAPEMSLYLTATIGVLVGTACVIATVFSCYDFFFWILFTCGLVAGLRSLESDERRGYRIQH